MSGAYYSDETVTLYHGDHEGRSADAQAGVMADLDLDAIEARANGAQAGPWGVEMQCYCASFDEAMETGGCEHRPYRWALRVTQETGPGAPYTFEGGFIHGAPGEATAAFIVAARTDVPALLAEVRALRARCTELIGGA